MGLPRAESLGAEVALRLLRMWPRRSHVWRFAMVKDPVSHELRRSVIERDARFVLRYRNLRVSDPVCVAPLLDPEAGPCSGGTTLDHVKSQLRMGVRAPSDEAHLVTLCDGHTERGAKAGRQWNTTNRPLLRRYLASVA